MSLRRLLKGEKASSMTFFLKSLECWRHSVFETRAMKEVGIVDQQLITSCLPWRRQNLMSIFCTVLLQHLSRHEDPLQTRYESNSAAPLSDRNRQSWCLSYG